MGSTSQEILRSFCSNTEWKYAVFWKLNHPSRMVLTLEDAYYDNHGHYNSPKNMHGAHDPLGLALAKMAYHVYSLGEGIVGHVAVSGEHQWVFPEYYDNWYSASEFHNVWESQISAAIKTILVVPVGPCGVVQLGSLLKVDEDVTLVNHIKHMFLALKDPLPDHEENLVQCNMNNSFYLPKLPSECSHVEAFPNCSGEVGKAMDVEESSFLTQYPNLHPYLKNHVLNNTSSSTLAIDTERLITDQSYPGLDSTFHTLSTDNEKSSRFDALISSGYNFPGSELLEALGSGFKQTSRGLEELVKSEHGSATRPTDDNMSHSQLTFDSAPENLLDAVVANVCHSEGNARDDIFSSKSVQSFLTSMEMAEPSGQNKHIVSNPNDRAMNQPLVEVDTQQNPSDICGAFSSIGFSSTCPSSSSDHFQTSLEMPKKNKRRAKPGESSRPRPRDRQLIQDRIKELRELVPNGSKCSIDSLLERTIKHMLFLQNVTKHADKLSKSANAKMQQKKTGGQGSTCAVEVGGHLQVCSIIVENLNKHGMVLIEMLCEECSHFLEISNVIRSLDLTILRGVTEAQGDKTWICFVVEEGDILVTEDQWVKIMGPVKNQLEHDICWAFVTAELVSAVRHIYKYDPTVVEYSCRDLVDFVDHQKRSQEKTKEKSGNKHFCYAHGLRQGFEYVKVNGILREESRPFEADCREEVVTRHGSNLGYIKEVVSLTTVKEVLQTLQNHPVAGCIPVFEPDYGSINDQLYYGPTSPLSRYETMHAISFVGAGGVKEGEKHVNARSSHGVNFGKDGYFKICFQHVIICLTRGHHMRYLEDPVLLPCRFVYPELLSLEKDKEKRRDDTI